MSLYPLAGPFKVFQVFMEHPSKGRLSEMLVANDPKEAEDIVRRSYRKVFGRGFIVVGVKQLTVEGVE